MNGSSASSADDATADIHDALHRAYRRFTRAYPTGVARGLTMDFLHRVLTTHLLQQYRAGAT